MQSKPLLISFHRNLSFYFIDANKATVNNASPQARTGLLRARGIQLLCGTIKKMKNTELTTCFETCVDMATCKSYCYNVQTKECSIHRKYRDGRDKVKNDPDFVYFELH